MSKEEKKEKTTNLNRRSFLKQSAITSAGVGVVSVTGLGAATLFGKTAKAAESHVSNGSTMAEVESKINVKPGQYDQYYGFWSGGQSGEVRILGIPSMREVRKIPVWNFSNTDGWGLTNYSKQFLKKNRKITKIGDTHHVHLSYTNGTYNGKYAFVNDKAAGRLARIRLDMFLVDKTVDLPHSQGTHGIFPSRNKIDAVYCNSEFRSPLPNDGMVTEDSKQYGCLHSCVDQETMKVRWQLWVDGNLDLCATDYEGKYSMGTCYNSEDGVVLSDMMSADMDWLAVFDLEQIERTVAKWKSSSRKKIFKNSREVLHKSSRDLVFSVKGYESIPIIDARGRKNGRLNSGSGNKHAQYIPIPKNPHGVNVDPTGTYAICCGKLSPTVSIIPIAKFKDLFAGKIKNPRSLVIAEPEVGLGPLHTAFDGRGNAYTSVFIDSVSTKWNIKQAVAGKNPVIQKLDVMYQPGHTNATMSETKDAVGDWLISLNKFSKDRFMPVGPRFVDNDQLIDISTDSDGNEKKMRLVHDGAATPEPHDCVIVDAAILQPHIKQTWDFDDRKMDVERKLLKTGLRRFRNYMRRNPSYKMPDGKNPRVYPFRVNMKDLSKNQLKNTDFYFTDDRRRETWAFMTATAPKFALSEVRTKKGYKVHLCLTNVNNVEDLTHGLILTEHDINFGVDPHESNSVYFRAGNPGVYWIYCSWFCHALHLEMRSRFIVT